MQAQSCSIMDFRCYVFVKPMAIRCQSILQCLLRGSADILADLNDIQYLNFAHAPLHATPRVLISRSHAVRCVPSIRGAHTSVRGDVISRFIIVICVICVRNQFDTGIVGTARSII